MKKIALLLSLFILGMGTSCASEKREKLLIAGSGSNTVAIIDKETKNVEWTYQIPERGECNSAMVTTDGNILFSYSRGARLVDTLGNTLWDFQKEDPNQEIQTARELEDGYFLAACGFPAKLIFLDKSGNKVSETSFDTKIEARHAQFRQTRVARNGNIIIPLMGTGYVFEIEKDGTIINQFKAGGALFSVEELEDSNLMVSGGFGVAIFDRNTGNIIKSILKDSIGGIKFAFPTQSQVLPNGNIMLSNWQGHEEVQNQPSLVEVSPQGDVVWTYDCQPPVKFISSVYYFVK